MTLPPLTDHVFRPSTAGGSYGGRRRGECAWLGTCSRPPEDHVTAEEFWWRRRAR